MRRRVVITGYGAITPLGVGAETFVDRWSARESGIADGVGACSDFEPTEFMSNKEARRADRFTQLAVAASVEALDSAGWADELPYDPARIGCIVGTGIGGLGSMEVQNRVLNDKGPKSVSPLSVPLMMGNASSGAVSMRHKLRGPSYGVVSACAAGAHALGDASRMIRAGDADAVVSGGSEATLTPLAVSAFAAMGATSPTGISRPFDARRDGFVMGEGAGVLVLEEYEAAIERGATILGEILGYAATSDAFHLTAPDPDGGPAARAMTMAMADAGVEAADLDYINAHGTSTPLNDRSETEAIKRALGDDAARLPISSTKSAIGHLLGAAGAVEAVATAISLNRRVAPPTLNYEVPEDGLDLDYVADGPRPLAERANGDGSRAAIALSNSFGFGGHNAVLCIGGAP